MGGPFLRLRGNKRKCGTTRSSSKKTIAKSRHFSLQVVILMLYNLQTHWIIRQSKITNWLRSFASMKTVAMTLGLQTQKMNLVTSSKNQCTLEAQMNNKMLQKTIKKITRSFDLANTSPWSVSLVSWAYHRVNQAPMATPCPFSATKITVTTGRKMSNHHIWYSEMNDEWFLKS